MVKQVLAGKSPAARAAELVNGTKLKNLEFRKKMWTAESAAVKAANDPMLALALLIDQPARTARKVFDTNEEAKEQAYGEIAKARFALRGTSAFPDATFTLRLSYGTVSGYEENGKKIPPFTDFAGLYARSAEHENKEPFDLPARWVERKDKLSLGAKFNFVCDADIIGGNSGSPVVNQAGQFVGIIFDGNIHSLVLDYVYDNQQARAVSVDSAAIIDGAAENLRRRSARRRAARAKGRAVAVGTGFTGLTGFWLGRGRASAGKERGDNRSPNERLCCPP